MKLLKPALLGLLLLAPPAGAATPAWVTRSNEHAKLLLDLTARFAPEEAAELGIEGFDTQVRDLRPDFRARERDAYRAALAALRTRRDAERDPLVRQDLEIMIHNADLEIRSIDLREKYDVSYFNVAGIVFNGLRGLLDEQMKPERRAAALTRLRRYAGVEPGSQPIAELAEARIRETLGKGRLMPAKVRLDKDLANQAFFINGIEPLFRQFRVAGYEEPLAKLKAQLSRYEAFVRRELLPTARVDFRLPPEEYALSLEEYGIDLPPAELARRAHAAFEQMRQQMQALAPAVAAQHHLSSSDYHDVIRALQKEQLVGPAILPHYQERLAAVEEIIRRQHLVTLPDRQARIRLASEAESAATPAPNMHPPRLLGNTGEMGEFVLPLNIPAPAGTPASAKKLYDFTFAAASWTLTAHEARPGHELQFASLVERGVSNARAVFAFNSTNAEGWGLYAEHILMPFMPPDGQLVSLQLRMQRAARAFLDPELQAGKVTPAQAKELLMKEVLLSEALANQEVERYTFRSPGQATSYFYGYTRLLELRAEAEKRLGKRFDQQRFHDFVLGQGLLPPGLMRQAVLEAIEAHRL